MQGKRDDVLQAARPAASRFPLLGPRTPVLLAVAAAALRAVGCDTSSTRSRDPRKAGEGAVCDHRRRVLLLRREQ
eukprot:gene35570-4724_t